MQTLAITDFKVINPSLAHTVISYTGKHNKETLYSSFLEKSDNKVVPIDNSFKTIRAGVAVGFVRANKEIRYIGYMQDVRAAYRVLSSNVMMDNKDKSLWEIRTGKGGTYLARHGNEDLSELLEANVHRRSDIPGLRHITIAKATTGEFASFISETSDLDYGFVVASNAQKAKIVSHSLKTPMIVDNSMITAIAQVPIKKSFAQKMLKAGISRQDKDQAIEYWKQLYFYDPDYLQEVIDQVNEDSVM